MSGRAKAQFSSNTTIVGGQPPARQAAAPKGAPVGIERVLFAAAVDPAFRQALLADRAAAVRERDLELRPSELAVLQGIGEQQLLATIEAMDTSTENLERRTFLRAVAVASASVVAIGGVSACTGIRPDEPDRGVRDGGAIDAASEAAPTADGMPAPTGIRPG